jgi:hypothetical protein
MNSSSLPCVVHALHLVLLDLFILIVFGKELLVMQFSPNSSYFTPLHIFLCLRTVAEAGGLPELFNEGLYEFLLFRGYQQNDQAKMISWEVWDGRMVDAWERMLKDVVDAYFSILFGYKSGGIDEKHESPVRIDGTPTEIRAGSLRDTGQSGPS